MSSSFLKFLQGLKILPGIQVRVVLNNGATANNGTGGIPYVLTGSLVAETDDRLQVNPFPFSPTNIELDCSPDFILLDLGASGVTIIAPGTNGPNPTFITLTGIIAINLNSIQLIAPVTPI
ncbi:MAG: hypothetical protein ACOYD5_07655 [Negativicutes bacterium]|jgi:hypothetical protein